MIMIKYKGAYLIHSNEILEKNEKYPCWDALTQEEFEYYDMSGCSWTYVENEGEFFNCDTYLINPDQIEKLNKILGGVY